MIDDFDVAEAPAVESDLFDVADLEEEQQPPRKRTRTAKPVSNVAAACMCAILVAKSLKYRCLSGAGRVAV